MVFQVGAERKLEEICVTHPDLSLAQIRNLKRINKNGVFESMVKYFF